MANGKRPCVKCYLAFALVILVVLVATGVWNPFPDLWEWTNRREPLSEPDVVWQQRLGGTPQSVTIAGNAVVVEQRTTVEARSLSTGVQLWERKADWAAVAGDGQDSVVVTGKLLIKGYDVLDPLSGAVRRHDGQAVAVWTYRDALLDVRCFGARDCVLTAWDPRGSKPRWQVDLPGIGPVLFADNPDMLEAEPFTATGVHAEAAGPGLQPALLALPIDGRIYIVDTAAGRVVQDFEADRKDRVAAVGGRVLHVRAIARDGTCYFTVTAKDPATGEQVWSQTGLNLRTSERAGCAQEHNPPGGQYVVVGVAPDMRETVLDAYGGRRLFSGAAGERVVAVDDRYALVRAADGQAIRSVDLATGATRWTRPAKSQAQAALTPYAGVITTRSPDRIVALNPATGDELANLRSPANVMAVGPDGMIIGSGREIGYLRFGGAAPGAGVPGGNGPGNGPGSGNPGVPDPGSRPDPGNSCGPKHERCPPAAN